MFGLGISEIIVIVIAALIFVGPKQLPDFIRSAGKMFVQVRRAANEVKSTVDGVIHEAEEEVRKEARTIEAAVDKPAIDQELEAARTELEAARTELGALGQTRPVAVPGAADRRAGFDPDDLSLPAHEKTPNQDIK